MLISIDGACKRNGTPECNACGVAWIKSDKGDFKFMSRVEYGSTNQRGEILGLVAALEYAKASPADEDIIIITDSEYLHNTVMKGWVYTWRRNNWYTGTGEQAKNKDLWQIVATLLEQINTPFDRVFVEWTKGHLMSYTPANINRALVIDQTGIELYSRILAIANRPAEYDRIVSDFAYERLKHDKIVPPKEDCLLWVTMNVMADCLAGYIIKLADAANI